MGKGKKKFNKKEAEHFYLLHRSQTDSAHQDEQRPSNFVLVKAEDAPQNKSRTLLSNRFSAPPPLDKKTALRQAGGGVFDVESYFSNKQAGGDHINSMGFKNDGYDYSQHLKVMGGGVFIGADGKRQQLQSQMASDLPPDVLPSGKEMDRQLEAITIDHTCMDDDLYDALFKDDVVFGEGDACDFEEICDDFVATAMQEPETQDFDYDKHIADLIARSKNISGPTVQEPRGWLNEIQEAVGGHDDDSDEVESFYGEDEEHLRAVQDDLQYAGKTSAYQQLIEDQFDRVAGEYEDDENIGDLEELVMQGGDVGEELCGTIELEDLDTNGILSDALNEFLQESKDDILCNGLGESSYQKGSRHIEEIEKWEPLPEGEKDGKEEIAKRIEELTLDLHDPEPDLPEEEFIQQEYLKEKREEEEWDCETILSTYSCLDNHPAVISVDSTTFTGVANRQKKKKAYKGKHRRDAVDDSSTEYDCESMCGSSRMGNGYQLSEYQSQYSSISQTSIPGARYFSKGRMKSVDAERGNQAKKIVLVGKHMLPMGYGLASNSKSKRDKDATEQSEKNTIIDPNSRKVKEVIPILEVDEEAEDKSECDENTDEDDILNEKVKTIKRKETAEEKKLRKKRVKEERKLNRISKKQERNAYRKEEVRQGTISGQHQDTDGISVFKY